ncbi:MAG: hypothetical protein E7626_07185 [Ruminococcaceae bacterium]|nr:hypothetical protein [Oscillospiraceae bacterium]
MKGNTVLKAVLFPHIAIMLVLLPVSIVFLIYSLIYMQPDSLASIISYVLAFYTLTVWSLKTPYLIRFFKKFKNENKLARRWYEDTHLRMSVTLYGTLLLNTAYALLHLGMGFQHRSFWFFSLAGYYISLAVMRFFLARYTTAHLPGERMRDELIRYRLCGWIFLIMNVSLSLMVFFMIYWERTFRHHEITTIMLAAYTFTAFTLAVINIIKYRKYNSPIYSASKAISLAAACVSMLTLEATMLTSFGGENMDSFTRKIFLGITGIAVSVAIIIMAIYMIRQGNKKLKQLKQ